MTFLKKMAAAMCSAIGTLLAGVLLACFPASDAQAQPANNNPCGATALTVNASCTNTSGTVASATASTVAVPTCGSGAQDVWYTVIVPASGNLTLTTTAGTLTDAGMAIYSVTNCADPITFTQLACNDNAVGNMPQITLPCRTPGATLYVRVWKQGGGGSNVTFSICATNPGTAPANDEPCNGTVISASTSCSYTTSTTFLACNSTVAAPACAGYAGGDVWFRLTVPVSGSATITTDVVSGSSLTDGGLAVYTATDCTNPATFTSLGCDDNAGPGNMSMLSLTGLTPGQTLYIRVWENGNDAAGQFNICVTAPPTNDNPCNSTALAVNASCVNTAGSVELATASTIAVPSCGSGAQDVWYTAVIPASGNLTVSTTAGTLTDAGMAIYTASNCATAATFTQLACNDNGSGMPSITLSCRTPGTTVYIRVWKQSGSASALTFSICATNPGTAPANDEPCGAIALSVGMSCNNTLTTNFLACASSVASPGCAGYTGADVWYKVVVPPSGILTVVADVQSGSPLTDGGMAVYSTTDCSNPGTFTLLGCDDNSGPGNMPQIALTGQTPGATLYIRCWENGGDVVGNFNICVTTTVPPNDAPCFATNLTVGTSCVGYTASNVNATNSNITPIPDCSDFTAGTTKDVWFTFTVPATGCVIIESAAGSLTDGEMALYSASTCSAGFTQIQCSSQEGPGDMPFIQRCGLTPGVTLYIRYWGWTNSTGTFDICVHSPAMPATDCAYAIEFFDSDGDGWEGASVGVSINGGAATNYTMTGSYALTIIPVNIGNTITVTYNSGSDNNDNLYYIRHLPSGRGVFASSTPPSTAVTFSQTVNCNPPSMMPQDCIGGITLCDGQDIFNNATHTGFVEDLHTGNRGCLNANERQGTWYHFSPSQGGTIGFTITPTDPDDDYDFAIWGPSDALTCIPPGPPLRCSFSELGGATGCGNGATDVSETPSGDKWVSTFNVTVGQKYSMYISNYSRSGLAFSLSWQLTNGASLDCTVLPIDLIGFEAEAVGGQVELTWSTLTEYGNDRYEIERSADGLTFEVIGTVTAVGNSTQTTRYAYTDDRPLHGTSHYRLKQVDTDGSFTRSDIATVTLQHASGQLRIHPNPGTDHVEVLTPEGVLGAELSLLDATGRELERVRMDAASVVLGTSDLPMGLYALRVSGPDGTPLAQSVWIKE